MTRLATVISDGWRVLFSGDTSALYLVVGRQGSLERGTCGQPQPLPKRSRLDQGSDRCEQMIGEKVEFFLGIDSHALVSSAELTIQILIASSVSSGFVLSEIGESYLG